MAFYKPLEGRLVEIHSLAGELQANEETKPQVRGSELVDFNGEEGRCIGWDEGENKYVVHTFGGVVVGVPEANLRELEPRSAEEGGFDVAWPAADEDPFFFAQAAGDALATKGYCVVQMFTSAAVREAAVEEVAEKPIFDGLRAELETAYLGDCNTTECRVLEADDADRPVEDALSYCDRDLTNAGMLLQSTLEAVFGYELVDRSNALVRTRKPEPEEGEEPEELAELSDTDLVDQFVESFLGWVMRRKLCMMYLLENNGSGCLELIPREKAGWGMRPVKLPLQRSRLILFRHDVMDYCYQPFGETLALQTWLLEKPKCIEFRYFLPPPGIQGVDRVHCTAANERFPANCEGCNMTFTMFSAGTDTLTRVPFSRFDQDQYQMDDRDAIRWGKAYVMHGSFVNDDVCVGFDNEFFGYSVAEAAAMSPSQRWVLEVGYETLHKAGWHRNQLNGQRIGHYMGDSGSDWNEVYQMPDAFQVSNNYCAITISRLSHVFGLKGPQLSVDTACSASLVATNAACHAMRTWTYRKGAKDPMIIHDRPTLDKALCMGVLVMVSPSGWIGECAATMLSMRGRCFTFDQSADGFIRGEGCCAVYLQNEHDFNEVSIQTLACVMGTCANQDGKSASLTAPHGPSQQECIRQCLREAGLITQDVTCSECHGTGTALGDPIEVGAVRGVMKKDRGEFPVTHCTAKAHVGHEEANAGVCGMIKIILMLNAAMITPNPHLNSLNAHLDVNGYPVVFNNELRSTQLSETVFGVSSFGFGGTNSRAECWATCEKGSGSTGSRTLLSKEEAVEWISKVVGNSGTSREAQGFMLDHKPGH